MELIQTLAERYGLACDNLNATLSTAMQYYSRGFYDEAARILKEEDAIDEYQRLLFPGCEDWRDICRRFQCEIKANIAEDNGLQLQTFLVKYETNVDLFVENRRLALENAPAAMRLGALYQLANLFPEGTSAWSKTIESLERRRNRELEEYVDALDPKDATREEVSTLLNEFESLARRTPAPSDGVARLKRLLERLDKADYLRRLSELIDEWRDPKNDAETCLDCLERYRALSNKVGERGLDYLYGKLSQSERNDLDFAVKRGEALERRAENEKELRRRAFNVDRLVESRGSERAVASELEALERALQTVGKATHPSLEAGERYLDERRRKRARGRFSVIAIGAAVLIFFASAVAVVSLNSVARKRAGDLAERVNRYLDSYEKEFNDADLEIAKEAANSIDSRIETLTADQVDPRNGENAKRRFNKVFTAREKRASDYASSVARLKEAHKKGQTDNQALEIARAIVMPKGTEAQKEEFLQLQREEFEIAAANKAKSKDDFDKRLQQLMSDYEAIEADSESSVSERRGKLADLATALRSLRALAGTDEQNRQIAALESKVTAKTAADQGAKTAGDLASKVGNFAGYVAALDAASRASDKKYDSAIEEIKKLETRLGALSDDWNPLAEQWARKSATCEFNADEAKKFGAEVDKIKNGLEFVPELDAVLKLRETLGAEVDSSSREKILNDVLDDFADGYFDVKLYRLHHAADDKGYYLDEPFEPGSGKSVSYYESRTSAPKQLPEDLPDKDDVCEIFLPYEIYLALDDALDKNLSRAAWFDLVAGQIRALVEADETRVDPLVKAIALVKILRGVCEDPIFANFADWRDELENGVDENVDYVAQKDDFQTAKEDAESALEVVSKSELDEKLKESEALARPEGPELRAYEWVGFVDVKGDEPVFLEGSSADLDDGTLWTIRPVGDMKLERIGRFAAGEASLDEGAVSNADRWFPVFLRRESLD